MGEEEEEVEEEDEEVEEEEEEEEEEGEGRRRCVILYACVENAHKLLQYLPYSTQWSIMCECFGFSE